MISIGPFDVANGYRYAWIYVNATEWPEISYFFGSLRFMIHVLNRNNGNSNQCFIDFGYSKGTIRSSVVTLLPERTLYKIHRNMNDDSTLYCIIEISEDATYLQDFYLETFMMSCDYRFKPSRFNSSYPNLFTYEIKNTLQ